MTRPARAVMPGKASLVSLAIAGALLSGCVSVLPEAQEPDFLVRMSTDPMPAVKGLLNHTVLVRQPESPGAFAGPEVAAADGLRVQFMNSVRWAGPPTDMLQQAVVDALQSAPGEGWGIAAESGARGDYELVWTIRDLSFDDAAKEAVCQVRATLLQRRGRQHVASDVITSRIDASGKSDSARASALAEAMRQTASQVAQFIVDQTAAAPEAPTDDTAAPNRPEGG